MTKSKREITKAINAVLTTKPRRRVKVSDPMLTAKQVDALVDKHGVSRMGFWQEAGGGDRVPMSKSVALRIIRTL